MARYIGLNSALLGDPAFEALSPEAQRAWFLLRLDYRVGITGIGRMTMQAVSRALDVGMTTAETIMGELGKAAGGVAVEFDPDAGLIWIRGAFRHEPGSWQVKKGALVELGRLPRSEIVARWLETYSDRFIVSDESKDIDRKTHAGIQALRESYRTDTVSEGYSYLPARAPAQAQAQAQVQAQAPAVAQDTGRRGYLGDFSKMTIEQLEELRPDVSGKKLDALECALRKKRTSRENDGLLTDENAALIAQLAAGGER